MFKLRFFVHCDENIGYANTLYFDTEEATEDWLKRHPKCEKLSLEVVTFDEFAEDYICEL